MSQKFDLVPFDIWHEIASYLGPNDYVNLSLVNRDMYEMLKDEFTARKSAQRFMFHSAECRLAASGKISYRQAIGRIFNVWEAVATANPYSVGLMGYAESFQFRQGVLCYQFGDVIRVMNAREAQDTEVVIDVKAAFADAVLHREFTQHDDNLRTSLKHYSDGIASCLCEWSNRVWLLAFDVHSVRLGMSSNRVKMARQLDSTRGLFIRNNGTYLYYGTHSRRVHHSHRDHHEWLIHGVNLEDNSDITKRPLQLENVVGSELGSTICFEIRDDFLYIVSNQTQHEEEEVDWTSFYICVRIPLSRPTEPMWQRYWRRQHQEGPLNDTWTSLSLQTDDETGNLIIVESRREWRDGGSENYRTYYMQPIDRPFAQIKWDAERLGLAAIHPLFFTEDPPSPGFPRYRPVSRLPSDDPLIHTLDAFSKPNYVPPRKRVKRQYHHEYTEEERVSDLRRDFPLSKTKFWAYHHSAGTFIDLVNDPNSRHSSNSSDRLRLRIGSRKRKCPIDETGEEVESGFLYPPEYFDEDGTPIECSEERYESRGIKLWPPDNAPEELLRITCPRSALGAVEGSTDERTIVYLTRAAGMEDHRQVIVLINFDAAIRFKGFKRLNSASVRGNPNPHAHASELSASSVTEDPSSTAQYLETSLPTATSYSTTTQPYQNERFRPLETPGYHGLKLPASEPPWFTIERASHCSMVGYWLR
ncbi:hypothetical protein LOZ51_005135 [Ophidiomyces ophidiicola]|nr:hypothetical protein LOZ55_005594 [Ophidiomyces ophidiicola]KAI1980337.1 hypothetical protein LOZ54_005880 [Ophidiomyces ophidiicola]KAI1989326.1 hypothetical protein LOZ51_005135 [Ophidiomyces ophidiicola]